MCCNEKPTENIQSLWEKYRRLAPKAPLKTLEVLAAPKTSLKTLVVSDPSTWDFISHQQLCLGLVTIYVAIWYGNNAFCHWPRRATSNQSCLDFFFFCWLLSSCILSQGRIVINKVECVLFYVLASQKLYIKPMIYHKRGRMCYFICWLVWELYLESRASIINKVVCVTFYLLVIKSCISSQWPIINKVECGVMTFYLLVSQELYLESMIYHKQGRVCYFFC